MTTYARINAEGVVERLVDLTAEQYTALQANGKATWLRLWIVDPIPATTATQIAVAGPVAVTATEAHQTWTVRDKTAREIEGESLITERNGSIDRLLADIAAQRAITRTIWDGYTAAQLRTEQWKDRQVLLRLANLVARRIKQEVA